MLYGRLSRTAAACGCPRVTHGVADIALNRKLGSPVQMPSMWLNDAGSTDLRATQPLRTLDLLEVLALLRRFRIGSRQTSSCAGGCVPGGLRSRLCLTKRSLQCCNRGLKSQQWNT